MLKLHIRPFKTLFTFAAALLLGGLLPLLILANEQGQPKAALERLLVSARDQQIVPDEFNATVFIVFLPLVILLIFLADQFSNHFSIVKHYVFIRTKNIARWYGAGITVLGATAFLSSLLYHGGMWIVLSLFGYKIGDNRMFWLIFIYCTLTFFLLLFMLATLVNVLSIPFSAKKAMSITLLFTEGSAALLFFIPQKLLGYFWLSHYFVTWHTPASPVLLYLNNGLREKGLSTFTLPGSLCFLGVLLGIALVAGYYTLKKCDYI